MSEDTLQFVGILDDGDHLHVRTTLWAHKRIDLIDLRKQSGPCTFARIDVDFLTVIRKWLIAKVFRGYAALVGSSPPLRRPLRN
jgi:hypothetical protein